MTTEDRSIDRRRFLRVAGAAVAAACLAACGPTATPVPGTLAPSQGSATPKPGRLSPTPGSSVSPAAWAPDPGGSGGQPRTATPEPWPPGESPLESPLATEAPPTPTPTPPPTPTPTPPPTPFPAGPPTKLGLFVGWYDPQLLELIDTRNVTLLKTLEFDPNFLNEIKTRSPETIIVGRAPLGQVNLDGADPAVEARRAVEAVLPIALDARRKGLVDAWEGFNEPVPGDEEQMARLAELEVERVRLLAENGLRAVVGNFGTGQPPLEWWPAFRPALEAARAHDAYLGLHEYSAPTMWYNTNRAPLDFGASAGDEGWLTLRYRKVYRQFLEPWGLRLPLLLTECGVDGLVTDRPGPPGMGWKDFGGYWNEMGMGLDAAGNYVEQLAWYDSQLQLDDYVLGASIFAMTAFQEWETYEIRGEAARILRQYLSVHPMR